jgi:hypothetical protein
MKQACLFLPLDADFGNLDDFFRSLASRDRQPWANSVGRGMWFKKQKRIPFVLDCIGGSSPQKCLLGIITWVDVGFLFGVRMECLLH